MKSYIYVNELNSNIAVLIKANCEQTAYDALKLVIKYPEDYKLKDTKPVKK